MLKTCCGFYCAMTALVGIYFFLILAIMEFRGNTYLTQIIQNVENEHNDPSIEQIDPTSKGWAFIVLMVIQVLLTGGCFYLGTSSLKEEQEAEEAEMKKNLSAYQRIDNQDPNQISSQWALEPVVIPWNRYMNKKKDDQI